MKRRRVVQRFVGLDVAQLAHVGRRRLAGVEDEANRVGVPDGIPVCSEWIASSASREAPPVRSASAPSSTPAATTSAGPRDTARASASTSRTRVERDPQTQRRHRHDGQSKQSRPRDSTGYRVRQTERWPAPRRRRSVQVRPRPRSARSAGRHVRRLPRGSPATTAQLALRTPSSLD